MKALSFFLLIFSLSLALAQAEGDSTPLPFSVSLGGHAAQVKGNAAEASHATIDQPVAANAALAVGAQGMIIVNIVPASDHGIPVEGATPSILIIQDGNKSATLDKTMDAKKFAAGDYLMSISANGKTASVLFKIQ